MASGCVPGSGGRRQDRDKEAVKVYLIIFIADLPLRLVYGCVIEYLYTIEI